MVSFSVIIPMYNAEKFLHLPVESLQKQTYKNFEALFVDDGSSDDTVKIARAYAEKEPRFRVIESVHKGRASAMRNIGMREAKNDYIVFLDSDDEFITDALEKFAAAIEVNAMPDVLTGYRTNGTLNENQDYIEEVITRSFPYPGKHCTGVQLLEKLGHDNIGLICGCSNIYRREMIITHQLFQEESVLLMEDHLWMPCAFFYAQSVYCTDIVFYRYIRRSNSITTTFSESKLKDALFVCTALLSFMQNHDKAFTPLLKRFWSEHSLRLLLWYCFQNIYRKNVNRSTFSRCLGAFFADSQNRKVLHYALPSMTQARRIGVRLLAWTRFGFFFPAELYFMILKGLNRLKRH